MRPIAQREFAAALSRVFFHQAVECLVLPDTGLVVPSGIGWTVEGQERAQRRSVPEAIRVGRPALAESGPELLGLLAAEITAQQQVVRHARQT